MKPYHHSRNSVKRYKGRTEDYDPVHNFLDSTKAHCADIRHRIILHNSFGAWLSESVLGHLEVLPSGVVVRHPYIINSDGMKVQVRDIAEDHIKEDLGYIPSLFECVSLTDMSKGSWLVGKATNLGKFVLQHFKLSDIVSKETFDKFKEEHKNLFE